MGFLWPEECLDQVGVRGCDKMIAVQSKRKRFNNG